VSGFALHAGDVVTIETSGGGGFGDPRRRDPARVARDISEGLVTAEKAAVIYGGALPGRLL
jgi:N-methylhydantoinase B